MRRGPDVENGADGRRAGIAAGPAWATVAGLLGVWISAGSVGLLAGPLQVALTWLALASACVLAGVGQRGRRGLLLGVLAALAIYGTARPPGVGQTLLVAAALALLADGHSGSARRMLAACAYAACVLAIYRLAGLASPCFWRACDAAGAAAGAVAGRIAGQPLRIGATFAGLDFVVSTSALTSVWLWRGGGRRWVRAAYGVAAIATGHVLYLVLLAAAQGWSERLPVPAETPFVHPYVPPAWQWSLAVRQLLPWNVPALAAVVHLAFLAALLRWSDDPPGNGIDRAASAPLPGQGSGLRRRDRVAGMVPLLLALLLALSSSLSTVSTDLSGKRIVANRTGFLDWRRPRYDEYGEQSAGMFGMLPFLVRSLGGQFRISSDFTAADLADADVVVLIQPSEPMGDEQRDRLWGFVRRGGSLLLVAGPYRYEEGRASRDNDILRPVGIRVTHDVAMSATGNWQQAWEPLLHPATAGLAASASSHLTDMGASLGLRGWARPLVVGRWGWSDPGSDAMLTGQGRFEPGERLGDLVLVAEQRLGQGRFAVVGDAFAFTNEGGVRGYEWTGRLLSHLARHRGDFTTRVRGAASLALAIALSLCLWRCVPRGLTLVALLLAVSLTLCGQWSQHASRVLPDGRILQRAPVEALRGVAYIDAAHLNGFSDVHWSFDGVNGLALNLMRDGYLAAALTAWDHDRLARASLLVLIAPARKFTARERRMLLDFVRSGGVAICAVGAEESRASGKLLAEYGLHVPMSPVPTGGAQREPVPLGRMRSLFLDARDYGVGDYRAGVIFHAAWPVEFQGDDVDVLVRGPQDVPIVVSRTFGRGCLVLIGDSGFALNKNLEYITGDPFEGGYENAHFWRWLLARVTGRPEWIPPRPAANEARDARVAEEKTP